MVVRCTRIWSLYIKQLTQVKVIRINESPLSCRHCRREMSPKFAQLISETPEDIYWQFLYFCGIEHKLAEPPL